MALLIILLLGIALFLLIRSMNSQLRKVPSEFMRGGSAGTDTATPAAPDPGDTPPAVPDNASTGESGTTRT